MNATTTKPTESVDLDLNKLEALARAATPGEWSAKKEFANRWRIDAEPAQYEPLAAVYGGVSDAACKQTDNYAQYIAAANPATLLALIALARRAPAQQEADERALFEQTHAHECLVRDRNMARIQHLTHERDQARADCVRFEKAWHSSFEQAMQNGQAFQELMAKNEDLRAQLAARGQGDAQLEPVYQYRVAEMNGPWSDARKGWFDQLTSGKDVRMYEFRTLYATPQPAALQEKP